MKQLITLSVFLFSSLLLTAQSVKPVFRVAAGIQQSSLYSKPFYSDLPLGTSITAQKALWLPDIMATVSFVSKKSTVAPFFGLGFNRKGTEVSGFDITYDPILVFNKRKLTASYLSMPLGVDWAVVKDKKWMLTVSQALVPELSINAPDIYKKLALSGRTQFIFDLPLNNTVGIALMPFFQTALSSYSNEQYELRSDTKAYRPFSFGLSVGCRLR